MEVDGWHPDPYGIHEERLFASGEPTPLVRDRGIGSVDAPPRADVPSGPGPGPKRAAPEPVDSALGSAVFLGALPPTGPGATSGRVAVGKRPAKPFVVAATALIGAGVIVGLFGIHLGGSGNAETTTTVNPLVGAFHHLPPATTLIPARGEAKTPPTTDLTPIEQALLALPRSTTVPPTTAAATSSTAGHPSPSATAPTTTRATQPPKRPAPVTASAAPTTLPSSTATTTVAPADEGWYVANGAVFNSLQTDITKVTRALASATPSTYVTLQPYWQELAADAKTAISLPPIPDAASQSEWATALGDLSQGAAQCILGSAGVTSKTGFVPPIFTQGTSLITTGATQLNGALASVQGQAAATSAASRSQVVSWVESHGAVFSTVLNDVNNLNAAFAAAPGSSSVIPYWQQLLGDAQSAISQAPIPDALIESYWTTTLNDLIQGSTDCLGSSEAPPPSNFDQGVALIQSGATYLNTSIAAVQRL